MLQELFVKVNVYHPIIGSKIIELSTKDTFSDLRNAISQSSLMVLYQNFYFKIQNKNFSQYAQIGQSLTNGNRVNIVFEPYDQRSSKYHFQKVKLLLQHPNIATRNKPNESDSKKSQQEQNQIDLTQIIENLQNQSYLQLKKCKQRQVNLGQLINYSGFNYPPYYRKLAGDFYYIVFKSPEQIDYHITANSEGFFVNQSSSSHYNPNPSFKFQTVNASLLDLLVKISPKFKQIYQQNFNFSQGDLKGIPISSKKNQWLKEPDISKQSYCWRISSLDRQLKRQDFLNVKDWNQILQIQNIDCCESTLDKITKDKLKFKIYQQFIEHSKLGAINIVQHNLQPLNPDSPKIKQTFLYSSILFSFEDSVNQDRNVLQNSSQSYIKIKELLKNNKSKEANNYIINLQQLERLNIPGLHLSHITLIKYKGYKIKAQSLPSSILYGKQKQGSFEDILNAKCTSLNNKQIQPIVRSIVRLLNFETQNFILTQNQQKQKKSYIQKAGIHPEIKWIQNKDKRKYILNLQNFSPKDMNFPNNKQNLFRPELIALYNQKQKCRIPINLLTGKDKYTLISNEKIKQQENKLKSMGYFAKQICIQSVINLLEDDLKKYLADSKNIIQIMHKYGLNCRYLGLLYNKIDAKRSPQLKVSIQRLVLVKSLKNLFNSALKSVASTIIRQVMAHLLNIVFYPKKLTEQYMTNLNNKQHMKEQEAQFSGQISKKKKKKWNKDRQKQDINLTINLKEDSVNFLSLTVSELQVVVKHIAKTKYNFKFQQTIASLKCLNIKYGRSAVLRDLCLNIGLVLQGKKYFQQKNSQILFHSDYILQFRAKQTCIHPQKKEIDLMIDEADRKSASFQVQQSIDAYNKAIQYIMAAYGGNNEKLAIIHKKMSNIYFRIGDIQTALLFAHHSCSMLQQFLGKDDVQTIQNNILLGFYNCAKRNYKQSQAYLLKSIYYASVAYSESYPELLTLYMNLSTVYEIQKKYPEAIISLVQGLNIVKNIYGEEHIHLGIFYAALASLHFEIPDIRKSIQFQQKAVKILKKNLFENDARLKQSSDMLQYYQSLQNTKKIKQIHQKQQRKTNSKYFKNINKVAQYNFLKENQEFWRRNRKGKFFV